MISNCVPGLFGNGYIFLLNRNYPHGSAECSICTVKFVKDLLG